MLKECLYNETNSEVEGFELILGYIPGYNQEQLENEHQYDDINRFNDLYHQVAEKVFEEENVYVTAIINKVRVIYPGCPEGGERVYSIRGTRNSFFTKSIEEYKNAVIRVARILATELNQETYSISWSKVNYTYCKKEY